MVARRPPAGGPTFSRYSPNPEQLADWDVSSVTPEELAAVRSFLTRRHGFEPAARTRLARSLADRLGPRVPGSNTWIGQPERFLEELERAKSSRT